MLNSGPRILPHPAELGHVAAASLTAPQAPLPFGVFLDRVGYVVAWISIRLFHVCCASYYIAAGYLYFRAPSHHIGRIFHLYSLTVDVSSFQAIAVAHFTVAALHLRFLVTSIGYTFAKGLVPQRHRSRLAIFPTLRQLAIDKPIPKTLRGRSWRPFSYAYSVLFAPSGLFGVESRSFETIFLSRELVEMAMQAYQAYTMSQLLPRVALNRFYVAMLVLNGWSTPLVHRLTRDKALQRLFCLLLDIFLDFISTVGVPVALSLSYLQDFDYQQSDFPLELWYNDRWFMLFMADASVIFFSSWVSAVNRLLFSLMMLVTIDDVTKLIKRKVNQARLSRRQSRPQSDKIPSTAATESSGFALWARRSLLLFAFAIFGVQIYAELRPQPSQCVVEVRPWLVRRPACAFVEINCLHKPVSWADSSHLSHTLDGLDQLSIGMVLLRHCPAVEIPSQIQRLTNLIGFKTYNCTLTKWEDDAALIQSSHPNARFLFLIRTNFSGAKLPDGLISTSFPLLLYDIEISTTNLESLPEDLDTRWPRGVAVYMEFAQFTTFPLVLSRLDLRELSLCGNKIMALPPEAFLLPNVRTLSFLGNPLVSLPEAGVDPRQAAVKSLYLDLTGIRNLPTWMDDTFLLEKKVSFAGAPICVEVLQNDSAAAERAKLLATHPAALQAINCVLLDPIDQPFYPLQLDEHNYQERRTDSQ